MCIRDRLEGCAVVPLLGQNRRLLVADGITGLVFGPFTPVLDLTLSLIHISVRKSCTLRAPSMTSAGPIR